MKLYKVTIMARPAATKAYELIDPREPTLPRYVGHRPWAERYRVRHHDGSRLGRWFRELDTAGVMPAESFTWLPNVPTTRPEAERLARVRIEQIARWAGCWPDLPTWLLVDHYGHQTMPVPVTRIDANGKVTTYPTIHAAARGVGRSYEGIRFAVFHGCMDRRGCFWVVSRGGVAGCA
jgi:hypothetical protein